MYQNGDQVVYGIHGVCRILDVEERTVDRRRIRYLALEPLDQPGSRYYVPADNPAALAKLRRIISLDELNALLQSDRIREFCWIADENQRKQHYRELICSCDRERLLQMICTLHRHKKAQSEAGRKFHLCDENFLRDAEKLLNGEFSQVLGIAPEQVGLYILSQLER